MREPVRLSHHGKEQRAAPQLVDAPQLFALPRDFAQPPTELFQVLETRRSHRSFDATSLQDISTLLWFSRRHVGKLSPESGVYPTPTAGGLAAVQVVVAPPSEAPWGYEPKGHMAYSIADNANVSTRIVESASANFDCAHATILLFAANRRYIAQYYDFSESLLLREAGALCFAMQLLAQALGLSFCALGVLGIDWLRLLLPRTHSEVISLGAAAVGRRKPAPMIAPDPKRDQLFAD